MKAPEGIKQRGNGCRQLSDQAPRQNPRAGKRERQRDQSQGIVGECRAAQPIQRQQRQQQGRAAGIGGDAPPDRVKDQRIAGSGMCPAQHLVVPGGDPGDFQHIIVRG
jgi:hypothetical protein